MMLVKYLGVGVINTLFGFGIIFALMFFGLSPELSNVAGYSFGVCLSYLLNKFFTFKSRAKKGAEFLKFVISMLTAYILNFITLKVLLEFQINAYLAQIISGGVYTLSGFLLSKFWAFKERKC